LTVDLTLRVRKGRVHFRAAKPSTWAGPILTRSVRSTLAHLSFRSSLQFQELLFRVAVVLGAGFL
jgi:hypothetical protein